ncbi:hypothetical protein GGX14DRAFT_384030 [Mycena pura]|uniref:Uncharacterized protein n=1 Tax=Mycena pura TaxID=153505 RepID=A0AAD6YVE1_9AGAR|nr:hypothetical protein GGX14DRAFT_384030 [Mycena pura]
MRREECVSLTLVPVSSPDTVLHVIVGICNRIWTQRSKAVSAVNSDEHEKTEVNDFNTSQELQVPGTRNWFLTSTVKVLYIHMRKPKHSRRLPGRLVGLVRVTPQEPPATVSPSTVDPNRSHARRGQASVPSKQPVPSSPLSAVTPSNWDGWPDGAFQCQLSPQNVADTNQLELHWACENIPGHRGSRNALTWQKGKEIRRRCIGTLECSGTACTAGRQIAPAVRGVDLHRQLQKPCTCGEDLRLHTCGIEAKTHFYRGGAFFINSGNHSHPQFTHTLIHRPNEPFEFEECIPKHQIALNDHSHSEASDTPSGSDTDSEWQGIQQEDGTEQPEDLFPNSEFDGLSQHDDSHDSYEVQCEVCYPNTDWDHVDVHFTCTGRKIDAESIPEMDADLNVGQVCMLPEAENRDDETIWFPAEFVDFDVSRKCQEYQFKWNESIAWNAGTPDDLCFYRAAKHWEHVEAFPTRLRDAQIGSLQIPLCFKEVTDSTPILDPLLAKIFKLAVDPVACLLVNLDTENEVTKSYSDYFKENSSDSAKNAFRWIEYYHIPCNPALEAMLESPIEKIACSKILRGALTGPEIMKRVSAAGALLLQLLAVQHNLGETLNLNSDIFSRIKAGHFRRRCLRWLPALNP